jgi:hypothetical protein
MINTTIATAAAVAPINAQASGIVNNPLANVFRPRTDDSSGVCKAATSVTPGVAANIAIVNGLAKDYAHLKVDVLDRSDRALWSYLGQVYAYVDQIEKSPLKQETRTALIKAIQQRDKQSMGTNATTGAIVVRYIFSDQSRQTRSNYAIAIEKARNVGVTPDTFAGFLEEYGGVTKVVEYTFEQEGVLKAATAELNKQIREEKANKTSLVGRLCTVMAHVSTAELEYSGALNNWVPQKPMKSDKAAGKDEKADPKYEQGNFVVFLTVKDSQSGKYRIVQGNVFNRVFEEQLLATIADQMGASTDELSSAVIGLEQSIGFNAQ